MNSKSTYTCKNNKCKVFEFTLLSESAENQDYLCSFCKNLLTKINETGEIQQKKLVYPNGLNPDELPTCLAIPAISLLNEIHPFVTLWKLVDLAEIAVRWTVAIALAEVISANDNKLPEEIASEIIQLIKRPTMGAWLLILDKLTQNKPADPIIAKDIYEIYNKDILPGFIQEKDGGTESSSLLVLRNNLAHSGGGMSVKKAKKILDEQIQTIEKLLLAIHQLTKSCQIISTNESEAFILTGRKPKKCTSIPLLLDDDKRGPWLIKGDCKLALLPLVNYGKVKSINANGEQKEKSEGENYIQIYANNRDTKYVSYSPIGSDSSYSTIIDKGKFKELFDDETSNKSEPSPKDDSFIQEARFIVDHELLIGRISGVRVTDLKRIVIFQQLFRTFTYSYKEHYSLLCRHGSFTSFKFIQ